MRSGKRTNGCSDGRVLGAYGRDELNNNDKRLLTFANDNKLASRTRYLANAMVEYHIRSTATAAAMTKNGLTTS